MSANLRGGAQRAAGDHTIVEARSAASDEDSRRASMARTASTSAAFTGVGTAERRAATHQLAVEKVDLRAAARARARRASTSAAAGT